VYVCLNLMLVKLLIAIFKDLGRVVSEGLIGRAGAEGFFFLCVVKL